MKKWIIVIILLFSSCASNHPWTRGDSIRQGVALTAIGVDHLQTLRIAAEKTQTTYTEHPDGSSELVYGGKPLHEEKVIDPIIGKHPTAGRVNSFFFPTYIITTTAAYYAPDVLDLLFGYKEEHRKAREAFQYITIGWEGAFITINFNHGIKP